MQHFTMPEIIDDKSQHCIPYLLERLRIHTDRHRGNTPPFFIGLNGVQGAGKTVLVCQPYNASGYQSSPRTLTSSGVRSQ
jgi:pantothenate kinase-related protein Tda10